VIGVRADGMNCADFIGRRFRVRVTGSGGSRVFLVS